MTIQDLRYILDVQTTETNKLREDQRSLEKTIREETVNASKQSKAQAADVEAAFRRREMLLEERFEKADDALAR